MKSSFLLKVNRNSTKRKVLKTNLNVVLIAEKQENKTEAITTETATEIMATDGNCY